MEGLEKVELPENTTQRLRLSGGVVALAWCAIYGWFSFVTSTDVPLLSLMQLAVHEIGHRLFAAFGDYTMILMGSGSEILFPLLFGIGCIAWPSKRNLIAAGMCWAMAAAACQHTSMYMADAPRGQMMLIGGEESDWLRIFDQYWDKLYRADVYAARMRIAGIAIWCASVALVVAGMVLAARSARRAEQEHRSPMPTATPSYELAPVSDEQMWQ